MLASIGSLMLDLLHRGGLAMGLLLLMSIVSLTLLVERTWFWFQQRAGARRVEEMARQLRSGRREALHGMIHGADDVYARTVRRFLEEPYSDALAVEVIDTQRHRLERFMPVLSTMVTAAPLVGLLGTVTGLINTFQFFGQHAMAVDPSSVGVGLSEALLNTAGGLVIAVMVIFPYNAFRSLSERALTRMESLAAAAATKPSAPPAAPVGQVQRQ